MRRPIIIIAIPLVALAVVWLVVGMQVLPMSSVYAVDFLAYRDAAVRLMETGTLYQAETVSQPWFPGPPGLYIYSPPPGIAMVPLAWIPAEQGALAWHLVHILAVAVACAVMPVGRLIRLVTFSVAMLSFSVVYDTNLGNVSALLLLPLALGWRWLDRPLGAVAQAVAISIRPTLGIILVWQLLRRQWRPVAWTVASGMVLVALTLPVVGIHGYTDYIAVLRNLSDVVSAPGNSSFGSALLLLGADEGAASAALFAGYAIAVGAIVASLRRDREIGYVVSIGASMLLSPLLWEHYLALVVLPAALLANRGHLWGLALPFLTYAPDVIQPFVVVIVTVLPLLARPQAGQDAAPALSFGADRPAVALGSPQAQGGST